MYVYIYSVHKFLTQLLSKGNVELNGESLPAKLTYVYANRDLKVHTYINPLCTVCHRYTEAERDILLKLTSSCPP